MSRKPCCVGEGLKKGAWTTEEDKKLISYINKHGEGGWRDIPQKAGLKRCGKSCRLRWTNYLKPDIKRGEFSSEEEQIIIMLHASRGNKWSVIARHLPRRTDNEVKNYWNSHLKKRLIEQGIDPVTHKPLASNSNPNVTTPQHKFHSLAASISDKQYSRSSSMPSLSVTKFTNNDLAASTSLSHKKRFKKSSSTSRLLNKVAAKPTSVKEILSCASLSNGFSEQIHNEDEDSSNVFLTTTLAEFDLGMDHGYGFSHFLENLERDCDHNEVNKMNIDQYYDHDLLMSDVSQEVSSTSVDDQDNMLGSFEGWSDYLLDHTDFIYDMESDSNENHFV